MEIRKVVIVSSGGQRKQVVETGAETLGQLKNDLAANGIDYNGMTFFEGLSKTELSHDDSLLPRDIPRNGSTTNNLVFMLTVPQKKIKSGAMSRQEVYSAIKEHNLQGLCMAQFGKNYTLCKTDDLLNLLAWHSSQNTEECSEKKEAAPENHNNVENALRVLLDILYNNDCICSDDADEVIQALGGEADSAIVNSPYTNSELEEIINGCNM